MMATLAIVGCSLAGSAIGGAIGAWVGEHEDRGSDFPIGFALYGAAGVGIGGFTGMLVGAVLFA